MLQRVVTGGSGATGKAANFTGQDIAGKTVAVSTATLKKGDLLFWGSKSSPYHVGIYVGGGQYVHAATPSQGVRKQYLSSYFWPSRAKRVI